MEEFLSSRTDNLINDAETIIEIHNLTKHYPLVTALNNVSLNIKKGRIVGLLGPNGSGKTTLIKILTGLTKNYIGNVRINGFPIGVETKKIVSYLPDHDFLSERFTVKTALKYYQEFFADFDINVALALIAQFGISTQYRVKALSKGNREKLQLILTLARRADIYIFDEPIAGVDPASREVIFNMILKNFNKGATIIISTHLIQEAESVLDDIIFLKHGNIVINESKQILLDKHQKTIDELFREVFKCY